jgi:hypothetical protein
MKQQDRAKPAIPLLPCPFEGGPPILEIEIDSTHAHPGEIGMADAHVWCHECGARGPRCDTYAFDAEEVEKVKLEACEAWNKAPRVAITTP